MKVGLGPVMASACFSWKAGARRPYQLVITTYEWSKIQAWDLFVPQCVFRYRLHWCYCGFNRLCTLYLHPTNLVGQWDTSMEMEESNRSLDLISKQILQPCIHVYLKLAAHLAADHCLYRRPSDMEERGKQWHSLWAFSVPCRALQLEFQGGGFDQIPMT